MSLNEKVPSGWSYATVGDILKVRSGYAFKRTDYQEYGTPLIRQSDIREAFVDISQVKRVSSSFLEQLTGFIVKKGDLLVGMSGSLGKIAKYKSDEPSL